MKAATVRFAHIRNFEMISIHAAREGGDDFDFDFGIEDEISIHAAREGGDSGNE